MVFFPLFDDEILELYQMKSKLGKEKIFARLKGNLYLLLAVLPADEVVVISPTFLFESEICECILRDSIELLLDCYITVYMKEQDLKDFYYKKQEGYRRVIEYEKYKKAYYSNRIIELSDLPFLKEIKTIPVGTTSFSICLELLKREKKANNISSRVFDDIIHRLEETEQKSFLWESVYEQLEKAKVSDSIIRKLRIREIMTQSYVEAYCKEGVTLAEDRFLYPRTTAFSGKKTYDIIKIDKILTALKIKERLMLMSCKEFCDLKKNIDYILTIRKVHDLIQSGKDVEDILIELKASGIDQDLKSIVRGVSSNGEKEKKHMIDILIIVAAYEEEQAIIDNDNWVKKRIYSGQEYFEHEENGISFALVRGYQIGEADAAIMAQKFIENLNPKVITMAGFCAGKVGSVNLGDIIIADKVYNYDVGKQISKNIILPEISNYSPDGTWIQFIQRLDGGWIRRTRITPPVDFEWQIIEFLDSLLSGPKSTKDIYSKDKYPNWNKVFKQLKEKEYIFVDSEYLQLKLTSKGKEYINEYKIENPESDHPKPVPQLRIAPIATGTKVQLWDDIFDILEKQHDRKTCALDMESHVIGKLGNINKLPFIVVKGVGDYARGNKVFANRFIEYTSYISCRFIIDLFSNDEFIPYWKNNA